MVKEEFYYPSADGKTNIHAVLWLPEEKPIAVLQISHGVTEHILRYEAVAEYFTEKGFAVTGNDHIGHGTSIAENAEPMFFGTSGSWQWVVRDMCICKEKMRKRFPDIPYCLLGFSLGSFLVRTCLIQYPGTVDAAVLIGTGQIPAFQIAIAREVVKQEIHKVGEEHTSPVIKKLTFETYNKKFAPNRTEFDWLCSNDTALDDYIADSLCGEYLSSGLFRELLSGMAFTGKMENIRKMDMELPILLASGKQDPVGEWGKGVVRTYRCFKKAGMKDVKVKLYSGLRHDILHENKREEICNDIYVWMKRRFFQV